MLYQSLLWQLVHAKLQQAPDQTVCIDTESNENIKGGHLLSEVSRLASLLRPLLHTNTRGRPVRQHGRGGGKPHVVALQLERSVGYVAGALAALSLGAAFLPLDPSWPPARRQNVMADTQPVAVLFAGPATGVTNEGVNDSCTPLYINVRPVDTAHGNTGRAFAPSHSGADVGEGSGKPLAESLPTTTCTAAEQTQDGVLLDIAALQGEASSTCPLPYCYVMYTSGSTGMPAGVCGTEQGIINRCAWMQAQHSYRLRAGDVASFKTSPCFVDSMWEVFGPLLAGVPSVIIPQRVVIEPALLAATLVEQRVTHLSGVPTLLQALVPHMERSIGLALRVLVSSGEPLPKTLLIQLQAALPLGAAVLNLYGTTEVAADVACYDACALPCSASAADVDTPSAHESSISRSVPVGLPISNTLLWVGSPQSDKSGHVTSDSSGVCGGGSILTSSTCDSMPASAQVLPRGTVGEVWVAGAGVAAGYLACAAHQRAFSALPVAALVRLTTSSSAQSVLAGEGVLHWLESHESQGTVPCFWTGDLGGVCPETGLLHIVGRADLQVKIRGIRVDLVETERVLMQHPSVMEAAARLWDGPSGGRLSGYVQLGGEPPSQPSESQLLEHCAALLPAAALPARIMVLKEMPRGAAGKLQRGALPLPDWAPPLTGWKRDRAEGEGAADSGDASVRQRPSAATPTSRGAWEARVMREFATALQNPDLEPMSHFFAAGGDSLTAAAAAANLGVPPQLLYGFPTARQLAAHLASTATNDTFDSFQITAVEPVMGRAPSLTPHVEVSAEPGGSAPTENHWRAPTLRLPPITDSNVTQRCHEHSTVVPRSTHPRFPDPGLPACILTPAGMAHFVHSGQSVGPEHNETLPHEAVPVQSAAGNDSVTELSGHSGRPSKALRCVWRVRLSDCVDAPPVVVMQRSPTGGLDWWALGCSHGGHVVCVDGYTGAQRWLAQLPGRCEAGMVMMPDLRHIAVACVEAIYFLSASDGKLVGSCDAGGAIKATLVCDPWSGAVWVASHGRRLSVCQATGHLMGAYHCGAAVSAAVAFDEGRRRAYLACLDGSVHCLAVDPTEGAASNSTFTATTTESGVSSASGEGLLALRQLWKHVCSAPLFSTPAVAPCGTLLCAAVDGTVIGLCPSGNLRWRTSLGARIFAPIALLPPLSSLPRAHQCPIPALAPGTLAPALAVADQQGRLHMICSGCGEAACPALALTAGSPSSVVVAATGVCAVVDMDHVLERLHDLQTESCYEAAAPGQMSAGIILCRNGGSAQGTSVQITAESMTLCHAESPVQLREPCTMAWSRNDGLVGVLQIPIRSQGEYSEDQSLERAGGQLTGSGGEVVAVQMPADTFSAPVAFGSFLVMGCRDDHLYCLSSQ